MTFFGKIWWGGNLIIFVALMTILIYWPSDQLKYVQCNVGQGDAALITFGFNQVLVDVGPEEGNVVSCLNKHIPFWEREIEAVFLSHNHADHVGGIKALEKIYCLNETFGGGSVERGKKLKVGDLISIGDMKISVLWPYEIAGSSALSEESREESQEENDAGLVLKIYYKGTWILLAGDASEEVERKLMESSQFMDEVEIFKVSHHGSKLSNSELWLNTLKPKNVVIGVGKNNFGHPNEAVLERLKGIGSKIWRTDINGDVLIGSKDRF